jgi:signal transduction histidine kinase/DNA-binding response OmpR family regulator/HPt (histidine-containing phosphotransfer) domain-containing protein
MHAGRLSLRTKLVVFNVGMVVVTLAVLVGLDLAFERVRINGPLYKAIDGGQAVVADILPPPLFIVESHLAVFELIDAQAHGDTTRVGLLESRLQEREAEFKARHLEWARTLPAGTVRSALVEASYAPAATYFQVVDRELLPALHRNDIGTARELLAHTLQPLFADHRDRVEFTVAAARRENAEREANAAVFVDRVRVAMLASWLVLAFAAFVIVRRGLMKPIVARVEEVGAALDRIGDGDTRTPVVAHGGDEFDQILQAIDRMRLRLASAIDLVEGQRHELEGALVEAQSATRAKSEFLANMSHEIRTPMNAVLGMTDLALRTELTERQRGYISKVRAAAESLLVIIDDILDFSKIEAGKLSLEARDFPLDEVFDRVTALIGLKAQRKGLELLLKTAPDVPPVLVGDPMRLLQVLVNLCSNAVKFTERGEIVVVTVQNVGGDAGSVSLRFTVKDTGVGLAPEQIALLFRPFSQVDASSTREHGGTGLGLAICRKLVAMMGGEIGVESQRGVGSDFHFTARFGVASASQATQPARLPQAGAHRDLRILVVDDSANSREILDDLLLLLGYAPVVEASGAAALGELRRAADVGRPYDLLLLDWRMPGMDGFDVVRALRDDPPPGAAPAVLLVTAYGDEDIVREAARQGLAGCLAKPVSASTLLDAINGACGPQRAGLPVAAAPPSGSTPTSAAPTQAPAVLRGRRVLLVEDNELNQFVATELLRDVAGMEVTLAVNGREALACLREARFDLVLMDIQMPGMDGLQATRLIRADAALAALPVIAMTAHAMAGDREKSAAAGMDDHVNKPFEPTQLFEVMLRWLAPASPWPVAAAPVVDAAAAAAGPVVDFELGLRRCLGKPELYRKILGRYLKQREAAGGEIRAALENGELEAGARLSHTLVSTAAMLGAPVLSEAARELHDAIDRGLPERWPALLARLDELQARIDAAVARYMQDVAPHERTAG